jgi:quinol monooxygenase YgiN
MNTMRYVLSGILLSLCLAGSPPMLSAQGDSTLYVVSYLEAAPASQHQVATMLTQLAGASREEGAMRYEVLQRTTESNQFLLLEIWKDQGALDTHTAAAHTKRFREQVAPLLLAPIDERLCTATIVPAPPRAGRGTVYIVTHIDVPGTSREAALRLMGQVIDQSRNDRGNVRFDLVHQKDRTNHFTAIEAWADQSSGNDHQLAPHTLTFRRGITPLLGALYDQRWYRPL